MEQQTNSLSNTQEKEQAYVNLCTTVTVLMSYTKYKFLNVKIRISARIANRMHLTKLIGNKMKRNLSK